MRKAVLFFGVFCLMAINVFAQENALKINPLSAFVATGNISYERAVSEKQSLQLGLYYTGLKMFDLKFTGYGITPEYRFYLGQEVLNSFYMAPFARYQSISIQDTEATDGKLTMSIMGGGLLFGRQWLIGDSFTIDLFFGPNYSKAKIKLTDADEDDFNQGINLFDGFGLRTGFTIGFAF